jgi:iron complex outermembrane recepter protein
VLSLSRHEFDGFRTMQDTSAPTTEASSVYGNTHRELLNARISIPLRDGDLRVTVNALRLDAEDPGALTRERMVLGERTTLPIYLEQQTGKTVRQQQVGMGWVGPARTRILDVMGYLVTRESRNPGAFAVMDVDRRVLGLRGIIRSEHLGEVGRAWWAIGAETDLQMDDRRHFLNQGGVRGEPLLDQSETVMGNAIFLQAMLPISPIVNVLTGLRYDRIRFSASDRIEGIDGLADLGGTRTLDSASPSFGVHAGFHPTFQSYLNLSTAFETPTSTELAVHPEGTAGFNPELEPQVGFTVEVGARGVMGQMLAYEAAYFHTTLHGELLPFESDERPGLSYFQNVGRSIREGIELALQFSPSRYWNVRIMHATNNGRFRELELDEVNYRGKRVPGLAPRTTEGLMRLGPGSWFLEYRVELTSEVPGNHANEPDASAPAYRLQDVRAGTNELNVLGLRLSAFAGITNLSDVYYNTSVVVNAASGRYFEPGPGRSVYFGGSSAIQRQR